MFAYRSLGSCGAVLALLASAGCGGSPEPNDAPERTASAREGLAVNVPWSQNPPGDFLPAESPQFVAVTFDDNFISGLGDVNGGMTFVTDLFKDKKNPAGNGTSGTFDGMPARTSFFFTSLYIETDEGNRTAWKTAVTDGHEPANHTVHHSDGTEFSQMDWQGEVKGCLDELTSPDIGIGITTSQVFGFRSPYLAYNPNLVPTLQANVLAYDSSVQSCWQDGEDATSCPWPYTLDSGSPDAVSITTKFQRPGLSTAPGFWELPLPALIVPSDDIAPQYGITPGLRDRVPPDMPLPSFYEKSTGKIADLDATLFVDAGMTASEVLGILEYNLDLHLKGNRSPFIVVAHSHVYADNYGAAANALSVADRQNAISSFIDYALSKPEVRMRPLHDLIGWLSSPVPLNGVRLPRPPVGGAGGTSSGGAAGIGGGASSAGGGGVNSAGGGSGGANAGAPATQNERAPESTPSSCRISTRSSTGENASGILAAAWLLAAILRRKKRSF